MPTASLLPRCSSITQSSCYGSARFCKVRNTFDSRGLPTPNWGRLYLPSGNLVGPKQQEC